MSETKRRYRTRLCRERGIGEHSFYHWRRRLRQDDTVRFALLQTAPVAAPSADAARELVLRNGERLRKRAGMPVLEPVRHAEELRRAVRDGAGSSPVGHRDGFTIWAKRLEAGSY